MNGFVIKRFEVEGKEGDTYFHVLGIDYDAPLRILEETDKYILAYLKGRRKYWRNRLETSAYANPEIYIFEKTIIDGQKGITDYTGIKQWEYTRETKKQAYKEAREYFETLKK